jgi:cytochrome b involved in lipid metabolism
MNIKNLSQRNRWSSLSWPLQVTTTLLLLGTVVAQYTLDDIAAHDQENDCWSVVSGNVFDLTEYGE